MSLQDEGFRFICRDGAWSWTHPAEIRSTDIDATDLNDAEFNELYLYMLKRLGHNGSIEPGAAHDHEPENQPRDPL